MRVATHSLKISAAPSDSRAPNPAGAARDSKIVKSGIATKMPFATESQWRRCLLKSHSMPHALMIRKTAAKDSSTNMKGKGSTSQVKHLRQPGEAVEAVDDVAVGATVPKPPIGCVRYGAARVHTKLESHPAVFNKVVVLLFLRHRLERGHHRRRAPSTAAVNVTKPL